MNIWYNNQSTEGLNSIKEFPRLGNRHFMVGNIRELNRFIIWWKYDGDRLIIGGSSNKYVNNQALRRGMWETNNREPEWKTV